MFFEESKLYAKLIRVFSFINKGPKKQIEFLLIMSGFDKLSVTTILTFGAMSSSTVAPRLPMMNDEDGTMTNKEPRHQAYTYSDSTSVTK